MDASPRRLTILALRVVTLALIASCESQDARLAEYAQQATQQQALQNERMAQQTEAVTKQSAQIAAAAHDLVEQDAAARRELMQAHDKLHEQQHAERTVLDQQRQQLDQERRIAANAALRAPVVAQAVITGATVLAALLPLLVTVYALRRIPAQKPLNDLLDEHVIEGLINPRRCELDWKANPSVPGSRLIAGSHDQVAPD
jgi:hypothetical protein